MVQVNQSENVHTQVSPSLISRAKETIKNIFGVQVREYVIGDDVTSIGNNAFRGCSLTSLTIGNSVTTIKSGAFGSVSSLIVGENVSRLGRNRR